MTMEFGLLTVSDRSAAGTYEDKSGPALAKAVEQAGWIVTKRAVVADEFQEIVQVLTDWADEAGCSVILTTGGTGFSPRDITPEATRAVVERLAPGLAEAMRAGSLAITPHAMLSRSTAGIRGRTLIINLPGSPKAALENFRIIAPVLIHAVQLIEGDQEAEGGHRSSLAI